MTMRTRTILAALAVTALGTGALAMRAAGPAGGPAVMRAEADYPVPYDDPRVLVNEVDNVFFGRVLAVTGNATTNVRLPRTQYRVVVLESLKGTLAGEVVVDQIGGIRSDTGELVLVEKDELLRPGSTYLFASQANGPWQSVINEYGDVLVDDPVRFAQVHATFSDAVRNPVRYVPPAPPDA